MIKLLKYLNAKQWLGLFFVIAVLVFQALLNIELVTQIGNISKALEKMDWSGILKTGGIMLGVTVGVIICTITVQFFVSRIITNLMAKVRRNIFIKVNNLSMAEINNFSIASLVTRSSNDITQVQTVFQLVLGVGVTAPLTAIIAIYKAVTISPKLSIVNIISVVAISILVVSIFACVVPKFKVMQKTSDQINLVTRENLTGLRVIRAYSAENTQESKFDVVNKKQTRLELFVGRIFSLVDPAITIIMNCTTLAVVWVIAYVLGSEIDVMSMFIQYSIQIIMGFMMLSMLFMMIPRGIVSAKRINEVLNQKSSIVDGSVSRGNLSSHGTVEFKNVSFKYPGADEYVLENISFKVEKGQTVAFIGSTGSGKSTLINLVPRFYDATEGSVYVDGLDVKDFTLASLHDLLGYVPQHGVLFRGSVMENLKYGNDEATDEEIKEATHIAEADFAYNLEGGLDYNIAQGGKNVSGGQKQRLSIARAILKKPEIFIFDDSFSALDYKTDKNLRRKLKKHIDGATCLIVAQRIGTIIDADQIIVLDEGKIVGQGKHKQLLATCPVYREIALSQLGEEELK